MADFERRHGIATRWQTTDKQYADARKRFLVDRQGRLESSLWASVIKRHYLLKMKAKYAGK